jgi:hypothetical protein
MVVFPCPWISDVAFGFSARPAGLRFLQFALFFGSPAPALTTHPKLVALVRNKQIMYGT